MPNIALSKIGADHLYYDKPNQDGLISLPNIKIVLDGCGSTSFPEVGVKIFSQILSSDYSKSLSPENFESIVEKIFKRILALKPQDDQFCIQNLLFTILVCFETEDKYVVLFCGDGFLLVNWIFGGLVLIECSDGKFPRYFAYNHVFDKKKLSTYKKGVCFSKIEFSKSDCKNVGVATDGVKYYKNLTQLERDKFLKLLTQSNSSNKIKMLINRNESIFKDDITICF